jgi:hypothetical protein
MSLKLLLKISTNHFDDFRNGIEQEKYNLTLRQSIKNKTSIKMKVNV